MLRLLVDSLYMLSRDTWIRFLLFAAGLVAVYSGLFITFAEVAGGEYGWFSGGPVTHDDLLIFLCVMMGAWAFVRALTYDGIRLGFRGR